MRLTKGIVVLVAVAVTLAACGNDSKKTSAEKTATTLATTSTSGTSAYSSGGYNTGATTGTTVGGTSGSTNLEAVDFKFQPATLNVKPGEAVTVTFKDGGSAPHNFSITSLNVSQDAEPGGTKTVRFTAPTASGDVEFFCRFHKASQNMTGTLHVA